MWQTIKQSFWIAGVTLCLSLMISASGTVQAQSVSEDALSVYEQALFFDSFIQEPLKQRLDRLEQSVLGEVQTGAENERQARLLSVLKSIPRTWKTMAPEADPDMGTTSSLAPSDDQADAMNEQVPPNHPKDATDYPTVTALERTVFGRDFLREDVGHRLSRLEKKVFGAATPQRALVDRVDTLLAKYPDAQSAVTLQPAFTSPDPLQQLPIDSSQFAASSRDVYAKVDLLERRVFKNQDNAKLMLTERLDRLEQHMYGKTYMGESIDNRVNRLMKPFELASNNPTLSTTFQNRMTRTAPQVIYNGGSSMPASTSRQNIQIGAGFSQSSQSSFSPELMNMLPNDVRAQLQNPSATTTTVTQQNTTLTPGFQPYGGQPVQYYNYYGTPGTQIQSQTTTTVIQPNGSQVVYGYQGNGNGLPNPAYIGDPAFLQQLDSVEANVFGRVDTMLPIQARLSNLETVILQRTQPNLPEVERLNAIFRAWKIQQVSRVIGSGKSANIGRAAGSAILGIPLNPPPKK